MLQDEVQLKHSGVPEEEELCCEDKSDEGRGEKARRAKRQEEEEEPLSHFSAAVRVYWLGVDSTAQAPAVNN